VKCDFSLNSCFLGLVESNNKAVSFCLKRFIKFQCALWGKIIEDWSWTFTELQHGSLVCPVTFHTGEVPSGEFIEINNTIFIQIKVLQSGIELLITEFMTKDFRKILKLRFVDWSALINIKVIESWLDIVLQLWLMDCLCPVYGLCHCKSFGAIVVFLVRKSLMWWKENIWFWVWVRSSKVSI